MDEDDDECRGWSSKGRIGAEDWGDVDAAAAASGSLKDEVKERGRPSIFLQEWSRRVEFPLVDWCKKAEIVLLSNGKLSNVFTTLEAHIRHKLMIKRIHCIISV